MARLAALLALVVLLSACSGGGGEDEAASTGGGSTTAAPVAATTAAPATNDTFGRIPEIVERVEPAVVTVLVTTAEGSGNGSGVIFDGEGHIVTNDHVAGHATKLEVALADGGRLPATLVATDPITDIAVIHVDRDGLPAAEFAGELPQVGELAIAMGAPLGFENSVSAGVVSGLHREIPSGGQTPALVDLLQTDAAISPGNSGGALVGDDGRVIGINVAYIPPEQRAVSIGFAIPSPTARRVAEQLIENGAVRHAYIGIIPAQVTPQLAQAFDLPVDAGVLVREAPEGTPAAKAGLRPGDVIVSLDGEAIRTVEDLFAALRRHDPGDTVRLGVIRNGDRRQVTLELGERPRG